MKRLALLSLCCAACADDRDATAAGARYGFIALLGRDTIAAERVTRRGDSLVSDGVDRFPKVRQRHTEIVLAPDGSMRHLAMDIRTPNATTSRERGRHFTADWTADSVRFTVRDSAGTTTLARATNGVLTMPHVQQMYSIIDLHIAAAVARAAATHLKAGDSVAVAQFYPDRDLDNFPDHGGFVLPLPGGRAEIWHDMLAGVGEATFDSARHMVSYSGARSTYKVDVKRVVELPDVDAIGARFAAAEQQTGTRQLSVRDTTRASIGRATFVVDYGRPLARGRDLLGNVIRYGNVWRTGANAATQFTTSSAITLAGIPLAAGTYTLWTLPDSSRVRLIVNRETGQWGTDYDDAHDIGMAPLKAETSATSTEQFTISIVATDATRGSLVMDWGTFRWTAPIVVQ